MKSIKIDVYVTFRGKETKSNSYIFPYNQEDLDYQHFPYDDKETKTGFTEACDTINQVISPFFSGKDLPLSKKSYETFQGFVARKNAGDQNTSRSMAS